MNVARLLTLDATLTRVEGTGAVDDYNNPTDQTVDTAVKCWVAPTASAEDTNLANRQISRFVGYFPAGSDIDGWDRLTLRGVTYEFDGPPRAWTHPRTGAVEYVEADLVRVV